MCVQSQEGGAPRHQCRSSPGAAGPGYEPQFAHLSGPGCRAYPGGKRILPNVMSIVIIILCCVCHKITGWLNTTALLWCQHIKRVQAQSLLFFGRSSLVPVLSWPSWARRRWLTTLPGVWNCSEEAETPQLGRGVPVQCHCAASRVRHSPAAEE